MSDPIVTVNWARVRPFAAAYITVIAGELLGFSMRALSSTEEVFQRWSEVGLAVLGGLLMELLLEWHSAPPTRSNRGRRRTSRLIAGVAYGLGAVDLVAILERVTGGLFGG